MTCSVLLYAILICTDQACAEEFEAWGEIGALDTLPCETCGCALKPLAYYEARPTLTLSRRPGGTPHVQLRNAA